VQLSGTVLRGIEQVLRDAERKPADAVLRAALGGARLAPDEKSVITRSVFAYYRWLGWLDPKTSLRGNLETALELSPTSVSDVELIEKAVPAWAREVMTFTPAMLREFQREPRLWLRARPGTGADLGRKLGQCELHPEVTDALWYFGEQDLFRSREFHHGEFEIQDLSSQLVGHACAPGPGATWWDACAGEGGKTLHLCDLMQNKGLVWASDPAEWRLEILKRRASRAKLFNYRAKRWTDQNHLPTKTRFDGILIDAPCSGLGTWGRNPHARWTVQPADIPKLADLQRKILDRVAASLKPGGKLIYSVCTLTHAETEAVANGFEETHRGFKALGRQSLVPEKWHASGMFIAAWQHP
jgi:16S rRNA (cytosine967-C5)-methyltransferase